MTKDFKNTQQRKVRFGPRISREEIFEVPRCCKEYNTDVWYSVQEMKDFRKRDINEVISNKNIFGKTEGDNCTLRGLEKDYHWAFYTNNDDNDNNRTGHNDATKTKQRPKKIKVSPHKRYVQAVLKKYLWQVLDDKRDPEELQKFAAARSRKEVRRALKVARRDAKAVQKEEAALVLCPNTTSTTAKMARLLAAPTMASPASARGIFLAAMELLPLRQ